MKPLYATLEDRMFGRAQRDMTDEEKKDMQFYCDGLAKYVGQKNTPALRKRVVADLIALMEKK